MLYNRKKPRAPTCQFIFPNYTEAIPSRESDQVFGALITVWERRLPAAS
jgi:hypothetical protein